VHTWLKRAIKGLFLPKTNVPSAPAAREQHEWSIGIYVGELPFNFRPSENINNPVLTHEDTLDVPAVYVADPFMIKANHTWYMFFEVYRQTQKGMKGEIGLAISEDEMKWTYQQVVLAETFHLSYPYVFKWMDDYYMIPESHQVQSVRLYKALQFPIQWAFVATLLNGHAFSDSSIFRFNGKWWILTETSPNGRCETLRLYYADDLMGFWIEHPKSPLIEGNPHIARPAGRVVVLNDKVIRYAQDCYPVYGTQVRAFEITELTPTSYSEQESSENPVLTASGTGWNASGMHHIDPHLIDDGQWMACVDGRLTRKLPV